MNKILLVLLKTWVKLDGWKSALSYLALQLPFFADTPWVIEAIQKAIQGPTAENIVFALSQMLLATGIVHRIIKNIQGKIS